MEESSTSPFFAGTFFHFILYTTWGGRGPRRDTLETKWRLMIYIRKDYIKFPAKIILLLAICLFSNENTLLANKQVDRNLKLKLDILFI